MLGRRLLLGLAITAIAFTQGCASSSTAAAGSPAAASPAPGSGASSAPASAPTPANGTANPCAYPDALLSAGLLSDAQAQYEALLAAQYLASATPSASAATNPGNVSATPNEAVVTCATAGLHAVESASQRAIRLEAQGDQATAEGDPSAAAGDYSSALEIDRSNTAAASGLRQVAQERPNGVRDAGAWWSQFGSNTLLPLGRFLLWALAVLVGLYVLYLLTRIAAQRLRLLPALPSWRAGLKAATWVSFIGAVIAAALTAGTGAAAWPSGGWWRGPLIAAAALVALGYMLLAWCLRSGTGVQCTVTDNKGNADKASRAYLAGRLNELGSAPPRGFDLPQSTDVTALTGALGVLPGGGMLSSLINFLLAWIPVTPWDASVTLVDEDQLLVTLHHNRQLIRTELANRNALLFPVPVPGQDEDGPSALVKDIDHDGLLTIAAAVILVGMADGWHSPVRPGLNGATRWESVAGQVLATDQGFGGKESFSEALLKRAIDTDKGNLGARVAQITLDGRRAKDPDKRLDCANLIDGIGEELKQRRNRDYAALQLRVFYSAAAGWYNVYLDGRVGDLEKAFTWGKELVDRIGELTGGSRSGKSGRLRELAQSMQPVAYVLAMALNSVPPAARKDPMSNTPDIQDIPVNRKWMPKHPLNARELYALACLQAAAQNGADAALGYLGRAIKIDDDLRPWARYDPSFSHLAQDPAYHQSFVKAVSDPETAGFTGIGPLASYASKLADIGVRTAVDLEEMTFTVAQQQEVAKAVGVAPLVVARWRDITGLCALQPAPSASQLDALVTHKVDSLQAMGALRQDDKSRAAIVSASVNSHGEITTEQLEDWARQATLEGV